MTASTESVLDTNRENWADKRIARLYSHAEGLQKPEQAILQRLADAIRDRRIIDLGVGGGRTTPHLLAYSRDYVGLDYSPAMVASCRDRFPDVEFQEADARDLSRFAEASTDLVFFSFNGIDCIDHSGRLLVFSEALRVLRPGGWFVFSSHNRNAPVPNPWDLSRIRLSANPLRLAVRIARLISGALRHLRLKRRETHTETYEIRNDLSNNYRQFLYYITVRDQIDQLHRAGFVDIQAVNLEGEVISPDADERGMWIYYRAQKP